MTILQTKKGNHWLPPVLQLLLQQHIIRKIILLNGEFRPFFCQFKLLEHFAANCYVV